MEINGEYQIDAPREAVWAALNDPEMLKKCIPGCESLEKESDTRFAASPRRIPTIRGLVMVVTKALRRPASTVSESRRTASIITKPRK